MFIIDGKVTQGITAHLLHHIAPVLEWMIQFTQESFCLVKKTGKIFNDFSERQVPNINADGTVCGLEIDLKGL